nr:MerR family DNA-binding transcriptional regulator [Paenibacillus sp. BJ-4]
MLFLHFHNQHPESKVLYTVKEVAKLLDLTEHTIRFYTDKGL